MPRLRLAWPRPDLMVRCVVGLVLVLQLLGPARCMHEAADTGAADLASLRQIVGHDLALCHHGDPDHHGPDDAHDCCGCGLCAAATIGAPAAPVDFASAPRFEGNLVAYTSEPPRVATIVHRGSASPRGPPLAV